MKAYSNRAVATTAEPTNSHPTARPSRLEPRISGTAPLSSYTAYRAGSERYRTAGRSGAW